MNLPRNRDAPIFADFARLLVNGSANVTDRWDLTGFSPEENYVAISPSVRGGRDFYPRFEMFLQGVVKIQFRNRVQPPETVLCDRYRRGWRRPSFWKGGLASSQLHRGFVYLAICVKRGGSREKKSCAQAFAHRVAEALLLHCGNVPMMDSVIN